MVRHHVPQRDHFTKREDVPRSKGGYTYYTCNHCTRAYNLDPDLDAPELILGRSYNYVDHLKTCAAYRAFGSSAIESHGSDASSGSGQQRKRRVHTRLVFSGGSSKASPRRKKRSPVKPKKARRRFSKQQKQELERLLVEFQVGNFLPDLFIDRSCTRALLEYLCPGITDYLPSRRVLGGRIVKSHAAHCREIQTRNLKEKQIITGGFVNFLSDVWQNIAREHLLGCQLLLFGCALTYALPQAGSRHDGVAMAQEMETILARALSEGWQIGALVTDNAGQCGRARRILALRWPKITFLFCFAHCVNNIVKAVLKSTFAAVAKEATKAVKCLNASSSKWLVRARALMKMCYGKPLALFTLCETRWNSMQGCFASLLRVRTSLEMLSSQYRGHNDFPSCLKVFSDTTFWRKLTEAEHVIGSLSEASYRLQRDENTLADVVISFQELFLGFMKSNPEYRDGLVHWLEARWQQCEQPLFMLTFLLNPSTMDEGRTLVNKINERKRLAGVQKRLVDGILDDQRRLDTQNFIQQSKDAGKIASSTQLGNFAVYYYRRLIGDDAGCIRGDMMDWIANTLTSAHPREFQWNKIKFWQHVKREKPASPLPDLAIRLHSIAVNTATTERLFSELGMIHTQGGIRLYRQNFKIHSASDSTCASVIKARSRMSARCLEF